MLTNENKIIRNANAITKIMLLYSVCPSNTLVLLYCTCRWCADADVGIDVVEPTGRLRLVYVVYINKC